MRSALVYDIPTRIFHWMFSGLFLMSFIIAKTVDDEAVAFSYHMLAGLLLGGLVLWRLVWGVVGSRHARFSGFQLNPFDLKDYMWGILSGSRKRWAGHNPASSWAAITMFLLALGLAATGYLMATGNKEAFEDIHEFMANAFIVVVALHVAGVIFHSVRHQDGIAFSMIDGKKEPVLEGGDIPSARGFAAVLLLALVVSGSIYLVRSFDPQQRTIHLLGQTLQMGDPKQAAETDDD